MWINTLAAGPPALALGLEPTSKDVMNKPPSEFKTIFTLEWYLDLFFYGFLIGGLALVNFVVVVFGRYGVCDIFFDMVSRADVFCFSGGTGSEL